MRRLFSHILTMATFGACSAAESKDEDIHDTQQKGTVSFQRRHSEALDIAVNSLHDSAHAELVDASTR